jgi:hypothetical protein
MAWDRLPRFTAQLVRWIEKPGASELLHPRIDLSGGRGSILVDAFDELGAYANGRDMRAVVIGPGQDSEQVVLAQTGPGLYEGSFPAEAVGDYMVSISAAAAGAEDSAPRTLAVSRPYSEEYRILAPDTRLLARLAQRAGGRLAAPADDSEAVTAILAREKGMSGARADTGFSAAGAAWPWLLAAALLLFILDIAARRLVLSETVRERLAPLGRFFSGRLFRPRQGYSYEELTSIVAHAREEEKKKLRDRISTMASEGRIDPDLAAYLYIARLKGKRAEDREKGK